jgi:hypothetical protein
MQQPVFLDKNSPPRLIQRLYHGRKIQVWEGYVHVKEVNGWVENPRIELARRQRQAQVGNRALTQDEVFDLMKNDPEFKLKELRDDIQKNGVREPIVLTFSGKLLDGNRRFFALKYVLETLPVADPNRLEYERIPVYVLGEHAHKEDEERVLVEENFAASLKLEWPDYVKAMHVKADSDAGIKPEDIAAKYGWARTKVRETLRIWEIIDDFLSFAIAPPNQDDEDGGGLGMSEQDAERVAASNYQFFNEAQKSFFNELKTDVEFKIKFFKWISMGKFSSFPEVRIAYKAWKTPEAKAIIEGPEPTAAKSAKAVLDYNARVVRNADEAAARIETFVSFVKNLRLEDVTALPERSLLQLREALDLLAEMARAAVERKNR